MQLNKIDNMIFFNNLESNIIEKAFIILKDNVNLVGFYENSDKKFSGEKAILEEAEFFINSKLKLNDIKFEEYKFKKLSKKYKILKIINVILLISLLLLIFI